MKKNMKPEEILAVAHIVLEGKKKGQKNPLRSLKIIENTIFILFILSIAFIVYLWI